MTNLIMIFFDDESDNDGSRSRLSGTCPFSFSEILFVVSVDYFHLVESMEYLHLVKSFEHFCLVKSNLFQSNPGESNLVESNLVESIEYFPLQKYLLV